MAPRQIVCLANSYKHGNRCVAGIDLDSCEWVRPISQLPDGSLLPRDYRLHDGSETRLLDVIAIDLESGKPRNCHPEDWLFAACEWRLLRRPLASSDWALLEDSVSRTATVLGCYRDRVDASLVRKNAVARSLALVRPDDLWWWIREDKGRRKYRALFRQDRVRYDLALTDPAWIAQLNLIPDGIYRHESLFANGAPETLLTVSLSEEFERFHYKLAAGVLLKPTSASNDRATPPHLGLRAPMATHSNGTAALSSQR